MIKAFNKKWNYIVFKLEKIVEKTNDKMLKNMLKMIIKVPLETKEAIA